tara:strand:- start:171 stop:470 length:300 start_codon:yes stop_codon:yes gene_type:complete
MTLQEILEHLKEYGEEALLMEPRSEYDECIIGIGARFDNGPLAIYSVERIIESLMRDDEVDEEGAQEWFDVNIIGGWNGPGTPIFVEESMMRTFDDGVA